MRKLLIATAAITAIAAPAAAQSISNTYGTLGYSSVQGNDTDLGAVTGRIGARFTPYIGVEGEASFGISDDNIAGIPNSKAELKHDLAAYVTGTIPVSQNFELFGRVGYGTTKVKAEVGGVSASDSEESINWGVGGNYFFDGQNGVRADWTRRDFRDGAGDADVWSVNFVRKF
ncbi:MAG TPA: porin family protein [Brevundimonas sp.]|uniref:porin family protein n=1 Tax=Brevundimonas sp. TaxID=1871086 RepID=UPI0026126B33|nr:porin family protein [Brevundimonas sp.]HRO31915.1 porin family protein [Brevundimonas sp.]